MEYLLTICATLAPTAEAGLGKRPEATGLYMKHGSSVDILTS